ncbi:aldo/keto reductase [Candidatus Latescibacterota bacterium]
MKRHEKASISRKEFIARTGGIVAAGIASRHGSIGAATGMYRILGRTKLKVSTIGYGTTETENAGVLIKALDSGVNFIDTGRMYVNGGNEVMIGKACESMRKELIIQTKFHRKHVNDSVAIEKSIDASLKALRTDYIDIMLLHAASAVNEINSPAMRDAFASAKEKGKIRFTGFSSHTNQIGTLKTAIDAGYFDVALLAYNHAGRFDHTKYKGFSQEWNQDILEKEMRRAVKAGMGIIAMKTCSTGPYMEKGAEKATFPAGMKRVLQNPDVSTMAVWMGNYREVEENMNIMG